MTQSRQQIQRLLTAGMKSRGWNLHASNSQKMTFVPIDPSMGGTSVMSFTKLARLLKQADELETMTAIEQVCAAAVKEVQKQADLSWQEARPYIGLALGTLQFCDGIALPMPKLPSRLFQLVPTVRVNGIMRTVSAREFASWDISVDELREVAVGNLFDTKLPPMEIYSYGVRALEGFYNMIPASAWLATVPDIGEVLGIGEEMLVCVPKADRLHIMPISEMIDENALDWFRQFNLHHHDQTLPFRLYEVRGGEWAALSADVGDPVQNL